jgi:hypothetical protein
MGWVLVKLVAVTGNVSAWQWPRAERGATAFAIPTSGRLASGTWDLGLTPVVRYVLCLDTPYLARLRTCAQTARAGYQLYRALDSTASAAWCCLHITHWLEQCVKPGAVELRSRASRTHWHLAEGFAMPTYFHLPKNCANRLGRTHLS